MNNPHYYNLVEYIYSNNLEIIVYRSFEFLKNYNLNYFSEKRKKYEKFDFILSLKILKHYSKIITKSKIIKKLKTINRLYNYLFIFMTDIFKSMPKVIIAIYKSAIKLNIDLKESIEELKNNKSNEISKDEKLKIQKLINLKKYTKKNITKMINVLNNIFKDFEILMRLPYEFLITIKNYDIFDLFSKNNQIWLDKRTANYLNNKYKMELILILFNTFKKLSTNNILHIFQYLILNGEDIYDLFNEEIYNFFNEEEIYKKSYKFTTIEKSGSTIFITI